MAACRVVFGASFAKTLEVFPHTDIPCLQTTVLGHALRKVLFNLTQLVLNSALTSSILDVAPPLVGVTILHHCMHRESCAKQHYKDSHSLLCGHFADDVNAVCRPLMISPCGVKSLSTIANTATRRWHSKRLQHLHSDCQTNATDTWGSAQSVHCGIDSSGSSGGSAAAP